MGRPTGRQWGVNKRIGLLLAAMTIASCSNQAERVGELIEAARQDYVAFDFVSARDGFAQVLKYDPNNAEAAFGQARTLGELNQYEEAIPAFEWALELDPDNPRAHEGYLAALAWGGSLRGRREWLDRAVEAGSEAILAFPDRVEPYDLVESAVEDLNASERWLEILGGLEERLGGSSVFRIHHLQARLQAARSSGDEDETATIEDELRQALASAVAAEGEAAERGAQPDAGRRYFLAIGYKVLGDTDTQRSWLARLDETPEGRTMGAERTHFDIYSREAPLAERLDLVERWKQRFQPAWDNDYFSTYSVALGKERSLLRNEVRRQREEDGQPNGEVLDRVIELGSILARLDTWGGISYYRTNAQLLIDFELRIEEALQIADEAILALKDERPGLLYPGIRLDQLARSHERSIASFEHLRGMALVGLDRGQEAEQAFRRAIDAGQRSDRLAALGELLAANGTDQEAYETLVAALAHDAEDERLGTEADRIRQVAAQVGVRTGRDEKVLDDTLAIAIAEVAEAARQRLIDDRLDREAPDFSLTDAEGNEWRLSDLRGKVVLLNYWATWCGPCRQEFPHYSDLVDKYASDDDVEFLAITTDADHSVTRDFLDENDYRFTVLFDEGSATDFQVVGLPSHFIIGPEGRIQYKTSGFPGAERYGEEMSWRIEALRPE